MIAVVGVLALASSARFYLVMTLGERVVNDSPLVMTTLIVW